MRILIVEDSLTMRNILTKMLNQMAMEDLCYATNGMEALNMLDDVELILTDINMPIMDGITLLQHLRKDVEHCHIPTIVITSTGEEKKVIQALSEGAVDYITKPLTFNVLAKKLRKQLNIDPIEDAAYAPPIQDDAVVPEDEKISENLEEELGEINKHVIQQAKDMFLARHGRLFCEVCGFDFEAAYGEIGRNYIEFHFDRPASELQKGTQVTSKDIRLVCANCHQVLHMKHPYMSVSQLEKIIRL